jgi:hypothetical protein
LSTLLPVLLGSTRAPEHEVVRKPTSVTVEVAIVEKVGKADPTRTTLVLPGRGRLEAAVGGAAGERVCEIETSHDAALTELSVKLHCRAVRGTDGELHLEAKPVVKPGGTAVLGRVQRADGRTVEVTATLR